MKSGQLKNITIKFLKTKEQSYCTLSFCDIVQSKEIIQVFDKLSDIYIQCGLLESSL